MLIRDIGILGTGLWDGPVITNDYFGSRYLDAAQVKDPYKGCRSDDGTIRIAGLELSPERYPRTVKAIERSFLDPYRGTKRRRYFPADMKVSDAETEAARNAIADAGISPQDIGLILVHSFLPDELAPENAPLIAHKLGLTNVAAWELDSICNSAISQMCAGTSLIQSGFARYVLCVQSCAYSRLTDTGSSSTIQEGDMASAFVLGPSKGTKMAFAWRTDGELHAAIKLQWAIPTGASPRRYWEASQERLLIRFDNALQARVMPQLQEYARIVCNEALARAEIKSDEVNVLLAHQPMSWNGVLIEETLGLRRGTAFDTFEEYGCINTSSIGTNLHHMRKQNLLHKGGNVLLFGQGAGYSYNAAVVKG